MSKRSPRKEPPAHKAGPRAIASRSRRGSAARRSVQRAIATWSCRRLIAAICLATMLALVGGTFASFRVSRSNKAKQAERAQSVRPQDVGSPSKEYIYLGVGGRLVATEEPAAAAAPNPPTGLMVTGITVTGVSSAQVNLAWLAPASGPAPTSYVVERSVNFQNPTSFQTAGNPTATNFTDRGQSLPIAGSPAGNTSNLPVCYLYRVRSAIGSLQSSPSNLVFATTKAFADDPVVGVPSGTQVKAVHILELRNAVSAVYATAFGTTGISGWDSGPIQTRGLVYAANVSEIRTTNTLGSLSSALQHMGFPLPTYSTSPTHLGQMRKEDTNQTRAAASSGVRSN